MIIDFTDRGLYVDRIDELVEALEDENVRFIFLKGGSGAGKSYAVAQILTQHIMSGKRVGVFRKVSATLKASCLQLFKDIKSSWGISSDLFDIRESKQINACNNGLGMMFGLDDEEKIKSIANFDRIWIEETTEITYDDFTQLNLRIRGGTNHKIICTFNPVSSQSWIKREVEDKPSLRGNATWISKTAWDNKFIDDTYLQSLESLKTINPNKYRIYAQNLRGEGNRGQIFESFSIFDHNIEPDVIGLDFGFNDPNALTYVQVVDQGEIKDMYVQEKMYLSGQTSSDLIKEMQRIGVPKHVLIMADNARPEMIADIRKAGYTIQGVNKYKNSKQEQIDNVKTYELHVNGENLVKELQNHCRKINKKTGVSSDVPEDGFDHLIDSMIYAATHYKKSEVFALF